MQSSPGVAAWHEEHVYFGRLLDLLEAKLHAHAPGGRPDYRLMSRIIEYLRGYSDRCHHPREDAAFAILERRMPRLAPQLDRLRRQHRVIAELGGALERHLARALRRGGVLGDQVKSAAALYVLYYRHHIATEEREAVWRAAMTLSAADWRAVAMAVPAFSGPPAGVHPRQLYGELVRNFTSESAP